MQPVFLQMSHFYWGPGVRSRGALELSYFVLGEAGSHTLHSDSSLVLSHANDRLGRRERP